ncbi:MAG: conserved repeat domain protein [Bacteroidetes bacterium]|nr:conserved repeat domain protein [Bacteroidota bacterium]
MKLFYTIFFPLLLTISLKSQQIVAGFTAPDTVCVNQTFTIQNTTTGPATTWYWNFCMGNTNVTPVATNLGNIGFFGGPVYYSIGKDGSNYYAFVTNNWGANLSRLSYGSSLANMPVATNLGNFGGMIPISMEDMYLENVGGTWYGIMVGGGGGANDRLVRFNFGNSLANMPTAVNLGNIGGMVYPQRLQVFSSGGTTYAFTPNAFGNSITRLNFGSGINNTPTGVNLGNIGGLSQPDDLAIINYGGNWYGYIVNETNNTLSRLDFGTSLLNTPTGVNLGNTGALNGPRGIDVWVECGQIRGLITNRYGNDLLNMNFTNGPTGPIITTSFGNIAGFSFPHSIERYRSGDTLFAMIPNVSNNTLSRIYYPPCTNASIPSSVFQTPPPISYVSTGTFYINLTVNETQINKSDYCKKIIVVAPPTVAVTGNTLLCVGDSIKLYGNAPPGSSFLWSGPNSFTSSTQNILIGNAGLNQSGTYSLVVSKGACSSTMAVKTVSVASGPTVNLGPDLNTCNSSFSFTLNAQNPGLSYLWNTGQTTQTIQATAVGGYSVVVTNAAGCSSSDIINISTGSLSVNLGNDTIMCPGTSFSINAGVSGATYTWSNAQNAQTISVNAPGTYSVLVNSNGCFGTDEITITNATLNLGADIEVCQGIPVILNAGVGNSYQWSNGLTTQTINASSSGNYWVQVNIGNCSIYDTVGVLIKNTPLVNLGADKLFCKDEIISVNLDAGNPGATYNWSNSQSAQTIHVSNVGTYSVMVTLANGCSSADVINIVRSDLNVNIGKDTSFCSGAAFILNAGNPGSNYQWSTGNATQAISVTSPGYYWVKVSQGHCFATDSVYVLIHDVPVFNVSKDTVICIGEKLILSAHLYNASNYIWSTGSTEPSIEVNVPGMYYVTATVTGCKVSDEIKVDDCESEIWLPNTFTPDEDGLNDIFYPVCYNISQVTLTVFDRWGEQIFEGSGTNVAWDGKYKGQICQDGVYTCKVKYKQRGRDKQKIGRVAILKNTGTRQN